ncbi:putative MATE family efflux protein [Dysgonomonadaceae bacterium PH5-43]|nr:putative MATE family efflux protein [Dysgonomonadaceae bacterium PH5-43]
MNIKTLTQGPIFKQLIGLATPIMATNFIQMAYTLTDMAWVGRLGSEDIAAVGAIGIVLWLTTSLAYLPKVAAEISIAQSIGSKRLDKAQVYASHTTTIGLIMGLVVALIIRLLSSVIVSFFHLEPHISAMAESYLNIVSLAIPMVYMSNSFAGVYNGVGRTSIPFYLITSGLIFNMMLDPLFIFGLGFIPKMGVDGAAIATVISQTIVVALFVWQMKRSNGILNRFSYFVKLKSEYTKRIIKLGLPNAAMSCLMAIISLYVARIASFYGGHLGVMSQTTGSQIEGITWNTTNGFSTALGTFVAQNFAAGKLDRTRKAYKYTLISLLSLGVVITISFICFGEYIFGVFVPETEAKLAGGHYLFIVAFSQMFMMLESTTLGMWNGYGKTMPPAVLSVLLNALRIPLAMVLASIYGITGVWIAITISAILKGIASPLWFMVYQKKLRRKQQLELKVKS